MTLHLKRHMCKYIKRTAYQKLLHKDRSIKFRSNLSAVLLLGLLRNLMEQMLFVIMLLCKARSSEANGRNISKSTGHSEGLSKILKIMKKS
jgi:hypothetical protein